MTFIRQQPPFHYLGEAMLKRVANTVRTEQFDTDAYILRMSDPPSSFLYMVHRGAVRLERNGQTAKLLEEGELFAYPSLLSGDSPAFDVIAEEPTEVYKLPAQVFHELVEHPDFAEFFLKGLSDRLRGAASLETSPLAGDLATPVEVLIARAPVSIAATATVTEAARKMSAMGISSILIDGETPGIITDRDLRNRVVAAGLPLETPVTHVMSAPLKTLSAESPVYGALMVMLQEHIHHLPLTRGEEIVGVITDNDLLRHQARSPLYLLKRVEKFHGTEPSGAYAQEIAGTVESLFRAGLDVTQIGKVVASLNDALIKKLLRTAEAHLGPPPQPYAWIVFGSEGREEQILITDQDNALIYAQADDGAARDYFEALAAHVVDALVGAGFPPCKGGYMATHWCYPLAEWERMFLQWTHTPQPQALMEAAIFFDFRQVHGELDLAPLHGIMQGIHEQRIFLAHMAKLAVDFQVPLGFLRRIREEEGGINMKMGGIAPIVALARLFALEAGISERTTLARLVGIGAAGLLTEAQTELLREAFRFLLYIRLRAQLKTYHAGTLPSNHIRLDDLSPLERHNLKDAFLAIREVQGLANSAYQTGRLG